MISKKVRKEYWFLVLVSIPIFLLMLYFGITTLIIIFLGTLPILLLTVRKRGLVRKVGIYSILTTIVMVPIIQYLAFVSNAWFVPSLVPRIFLSHSIEDYFSVFLLVYSIIGLYEYFCEKEKILKFPKGFRQLIIISYLILASSMYLFFYLDLELVVPYFYFYFILSGLLLVFFACYRHKKLFNKILVVSGIYVPLCFLAEYAAITNGAWLFPGDEYIGYFSLLSVTFPLEELIYILIQPAVIISAYELTADDGK